MRPDPQPAPAAPLRIAVVALCAVLALVPCRAHAVGVGTALTPAVGFVAPGSVIEVDLAIPQLPDTSFNGFRAVVAYDPAALTFVQAAPISAQLGCLMNGTCSAACGGTFHSFHAAGDSVSVDLSLLCDSLSLTGPGQLYRLQFLASNTDQVTWVTTRRVVFFDAGVRIQAGAIADSRIVIGSPAGVPGVADVQAWRITAWPNPAPNGVALLVTAPADGVQDLDVLDVSGRAVRRLAGGWRPRGSRSVGWDGTAAGGARLPAGIYLVRLRAGMNVATTRVTLLP